MGAGGSSCCGLTDGCSAAAAREPPYHRSAADGASHPGPSGGRQGRRTPRTAAVSCSSLLGSTKPPHGARPRLTPRPWPHEAAPARAPAERGACPQARPPATPAVQRHARPAAPTPDPLAHRAGGPRSRRRACSKRARGEQRTPPTARSRPPHGRRPVKTRRAQPGFSPTAEPAEPTEDAFEAAVETAPALEPNQALGAA